MITLISPPGLKSFSGLQMHMPNPPIGLAYVAGTLRAAGLDFKFIDGAGEVLDAVSRYPNRNDLMVQGLSIEEIVERIPAQSTIVGVSCMFSTLWPLAREIAEATRQRFPDILLVLGGEHGTAVPNNVLENSPFDVVVLGEGEETFVNLISAHGDDRPFDLVPGIAFRRDGVIHNTGLSPRRRDVDDIPLPDWNSLPIEEYIARHQLNGVNLGRSMPMLSTRGCPYQCAFCSNPNMWTTRYVPRDPKRVVDEMELYMRRYQATNFDFQDLTAIVNRRWVMEFCHELIDRDLNITWQMPSGTRAEIFDKEIADLLYRSGCRVLSFAPESGAPEILKIIKKQVDLEKMLEAVRVTLDRGLILSCFFVIGFPADTPQTIAQTMRLLRKLAVMGVYDVSVAKFVPYPGSEFFYQLQADGKVELDDEFFVSPIDFYSKSAPSYADSIGSRRLYFTMIWMYLNFYIISFLCRPFRTARILFNATLKGKEETRYAKWFVDRFFVRRRWQKMAKSSA